MKELIEIQQELKAPKGQLNKFGNYNYRSAEDILEAVKPLLAKHNALLLLTDEVKEVGNYMYVEATAVFQIGENAISVKAQAGINPTRKGMDISQSFGSSSSLCKKICIRKPFPIWMIHKMQTAKIIVLSINHLLQMN